MEKSILFTNGENEIKAELIEGEWNAPIGCCFPTKEIMIDFLHDNGYTSKEHPKPLRGLAQYLAEGGRVWD